MTTTAPSRLLGDPALAHYANRPPRSERRYRPYLLSEPEERIDAEKEVTGASAWCRLFSEQTAELRVRLGDEDLALDEAIARLSLEHEQDERGSVAEAVTETPPAGREDPRLHPQHDRQRACDR